MKLDKKTVAIILLAIFSIINFFKKGETKTETYTVTVPEIVTVTDTIKLEPEPAKIVYLKGDTEYIADSTYYEKYIQAKDSLEKLELYLDAITIREYKKVLVDNDTILVEVNSKTRGTLLSQFANVTIKERSIVYEPKKVIVMPRLRVLGGIETTIPSLPTEKFAISGNLMFQNKKGDAFKLGVDSNQSINFGLYKSLFKIK